MLGRQQVFLDLNDEIEEYDDLVEIMSNAHLNNNFLALAREVSCKLRHFCAIKPLTSNKNKSFKYYFITVRKCIEKINVMPSPCSYIYVKNRKTFSVL